MIRFIFEIIIFQVPHLPSTHRGGRGRPTSTQHDTFYIRNDHFSDSPSAIHPQWGPICHPPTEGGDGDQNEHKMIRFIFEMIIFQVPHLPSTHRGGRGRPKSTQNDTFYIRNAYASGSPSAIHPQRGARDTKIHTK